MMNLTGKAGENHQMPAEDYYIVSIQSRRGLWALMKLLPVYKWQKNQPQEKESQALGMRLWSGSRIRFGHLGV